MIFFSSNIYFKVAIEKNWHSQSFDFLSLKNSYPIPFKHNSIVIFPMALTLYCIMSQNGQTDFKNLDHWRFVKCIRSSRPDVICKKVVFRNFAKFTGKHPCQSLVFNKVTGRLQLYYKGTVSQLFSCESCEISKNTSSGCFWCI